MLDRPVAMQTAGHGGANRALSVWPTRARGSAGPQGAVNFQTPLGLTCFIW